VKILKLNRDSVSESKYSYTITKGNNTKDYYIELNFFESLFDIMLEVEFSKTDLLIDIWEIKLKTEII